MSRPARRASALLLVALLSCVHAAPIAAMWRGDEAHCGCTSVICCCATPPEAPVRPAPSRSCHDGAHLPVLDISRVGAGKKIQPLPISERKQLDLRTVFGQANHALEEEAELHEKTN